jgi:Mg-chelatase subunit ChlD
MPTSARRNGLLRRAAATTAGLLLATLAAAAMTTSATANARASADAAARPAVPPFATDTEVEAALGLKAVVPTLFVFLVDLSDSMQSDGMYDEVKSVLPGYLAALDRNDLVAVLPIEQPHPVVSPIYPLGPPPANVGLLGLPKYAHGGTTDYGQAFSEALDQFNTPLPKGIKAGAVVLLSDGRPDEADDPAYRGPASDPYQTAAWADLRVRAAHLSIPVTAFAVSLTNKKQVISDQKTALSQVFSPVEPLPGADDLGYALQQAEAHVVDGEVAFDVAADSDQGVQVAWSGLPSGGSPLNLKSAGNLDVTVTVTSLTRKVPLYLQGLQMTSPGLPFKLTGTLPSDVTLDPGKPVSIPFRLTWTKDTTGWSPWSATSNLSGRLALTATVGSPWMPALLDFHDAKFSVGALHGNASPQLTAVTATTDLFMYLALVIGLIVLAVVVALAWLLFRALLRGKLTLTSVDDCSGEFPLPRRLHASVPTEGLIGIPGQVTVRGLMFNSAREMRVTLKLAGRPEGDLKLKPGGRTMTVGIDIVHSGAR